MTCCTGILCICRAARTQEETEELQSLLSSLNIGSSSISSSIRATATTVQQQQQALPGGTAAGCAEQDMEQE